MSTSKTTINTVATNSGVAARAFLTAMRTRMQSVGFTLTTDTGQIDEATLTVSASSANTLWGHRIFRTPDTDPFAASLPIWMKLRFRNQAGISSSYDPTVYPHFGIDSDGAGNLDKLWTPLNDGSWPQICAPNPNALMYLVRNNFMGGWFIGGAEGDSYDDAAGGFFYHRTVDETGNPTDEGFYALTFSNPSHLAPANVGGYYQQSSFLTNTWITAYSIGGSNPTIYALPVTENYYDRTRGKWRGETHPHGGGHKGFRILDVPAVGLDDGKVLHYPFQGNKFDSIDRPLTGLVAYNRAFHTVGETFMLDRYGVSRPFMATPLRIGSSLGGNQKIDYRLGILWE